MDNKELSEYLLSNFHDAQYQRQSLIDIFLKDEKYYLKLFMYGAVERKAHDFLMKYKKQLKSAEAIKLEALRKVKYSEYIDEYIKTVSVDGSKDLEQKRTDVLPDDSASLVFEAEHKEVYIKLLCLADKSKMRVSKILKTQKTKSSEAMEIPIYVCPECGKSYTSLRQFANKKKIKISGKTYVNLSPQQNSAYYKNNVDSVKVRKISQGAFFAYVGQADICRNERCQKCRLIRVSAVFVDKLGNKKYTETKYCSKCHAYYIKINDLELDSFPFEIINMDELPEIQRQYQEMIEEAEARRLEKKERRRKAKEEKKRLKQKAEEAEVKRILEEKSKAGIKVAFIKQDKLKGLERKRQEENNNSIVSKKREQEVSIPQNHNAHKTEKETKVIDARDFVVRRSVFKCMHNQHVINDITATVAIIDKSGNLRSANISAGYCAECKVYFIMESTFQNLKRQGIPVCRVSDEKNYLKSASINGMKLANESILMQYGYNVGQGEALSQTVRHKILANLVDNHILSKSEIISYLDFFISQRQSQAKYNIAINKWEKDRDFIENYKIGKRPEMGVLGLYR